MSEETPRRYSDWDTSNQGQALQFLKRLTENDISFEAKRTVSHDQRDGTMSHWHFRFPTKDVINILATTLSDEREVK